MLGRTICNYLHRSRPLSSHLYGEMRCFWCWQAQFASIYTGLALSPPICKVKYIVFGAGKHNLSLFTQISHPLLPSIWRNMLCVVLGSTICRYLHRSRPLSSHSYNKIHYFGCQETQFVAVYSGLALFPFI